LLAEAIPAQLRRLASSVDVARDGRVMTIGDGGASGARGHTWWDRPQIHLRADIPRNFPITPYRLIDDWRLRSCSYRCASEVRCDACGYVYAALFAFVNARELTFSLARRELAHRFARSRVASQLIIREKIFARASRDTRVKFFFRRASSMSSSRVIGSRRITSPGRARFCHDP
jgi:hypothetical protein